LALDWDHGGHHLHRQVADARLAFPAEHRQTSETIFDLPLEYALIAFPDAKPTGKVVPELRNGSAAVLFLWENLWIANLRKAIVDAGGELVERAQIAPEVVEEFVQALASEQEGQEAGS
jgi:hypothetical protein